MKDTSEKRWNMSQLEINGLKVVDLFCGGGVGACGFKLAGYEMVYGIDNEKYAVDTYNKNIGNHAVLKDIRELKSYEIPEHDLMVATPVCKSFSFAGKGQGENDKRYGDLIYEFIRLLKETTPKSFLFENVSGIVSKKHIEFFNRFLIDLEKIGYTLSWKLIDCYNYGVPQKRKRVFIIGIRSDLNKKFEFPLEVNDDEKTTIRDAIGDLPEPNNIINHYGYGIRNDELPFVDKINYGENWTNLPLEDQMIFLGGAFNSKGGRTGFLRKVDFSKPSFTITSCMNGKNNAQILDNKDKYSKSNNSIESCRRFTVRECLRLQTVPDWFVFDDKITIGHQYERCSGIPSLIAYKIGIEIEKILNNN